MLHKIPSLFPWKHNKTKIMAEPVLEEDVNLDDQLAPCTICGRTFLPTPLAKHSKICEKNATKKRKIFNSLKQRVEGTDLAPFHQQSYLKKPEKVAEAKSTWKEKHQELVTTIREAKNTTHLEKTISPQKQRSLSMMNANFERCQTCDRQFGPKAYDRHVEWCKERKNRLPQSPANVEQAKQRLEARIKYKVPPMSKPRITNRERYQSPMKAPPLRQQEALPLTVKSSTNLDRRPSIKKTPEKLEKIEVKPLKTEPLKRDNTYNPLLIAERQLMELLECDDFNTFTPSKPKTTTSSTKNTKKHKRASVIDPPTDFQDRPDSPDVFDENFDLIENFINDNLSDEMILDKLDSISLSSQKTFTACTENFNTFCDELSIDPRLINECDNLSIPENLSVGDRSPAERKFFAGGKKLPALQHSEKSVNLNEMDDLIASVAQKQPQSAKVLKTQQSCSFGGNGDSKKKNLSTLKRSISSLDPVKPKNLRNKEDVQTYFQEQEIRSSPKSNVRKKDEVQSYLREHDVKSSPKSNVRKKEPVCVSAVTEELFPIDDEMYEEYKKYEQIYLQEKEEKMKLELERRTHEDDSKISADSAYGSLSRNKPKVRTRMAKLSPLDMRDSRADSASSSGSETSLAHNNAAKYCHECGSKYPLNTAKFCVECGVKRLVL